MRNVRILLLAWPLGLSAAALAAPDPASSATAPASEHRLSPDQIKTILDDAARKRELADPLDEALPPAIHGEMGFAIGTGGYRSAFGTAVVPLPGDGAAILSFGTDRFGPARDFHYRDR